MEFPARSITEQETELVAEYLTFNEDQAYKFFKALENLPRKALCFNGENGDQRIITYDNAKRIAYEQSNKNFV